MCPGQFRTDPDGFWRSLYDPKKLNFEEAQARFLLTSDAYIEFLKTTDAAQERMESTRALHRIITEILRLNDQQMNATRRLEIYVMLYMRTCLPKSITEDEIQSESVKLVGENRGKPNNLILAMEAFVDFEPYRYRQQVEMVNITG